MDAGWDFIVIFTTGLGVTFIRLHVGKTESSQAVRRFYCVTASRAIRNTTFMAMSCTNWFLRSSINFLCLMIGLSTQRPPSKEVWILWMGVLQWWAISERRRLWSVGVSNQV